MDLVIALAGHVLALVAWVAAAIAVFGAAAGSHGL